MRPSPAVGGVILLCLVWAAPAMADQRFQATLTAAQEAPATASVATGIGTVVLNTAGTEIVVNLTFSGLTGNPAGAHIHGASAVGVNAGVLFDLSGVMPAATSGTIPPQTFAISEAQVTQLEAGQFYFNIHTGSFPGGEIRGQILAAPAQKHSATLSGAQEVPPTASAATASGTVHLNATEDQITVNLSFANLTGNPIGAHIHSAAAGVNGPIVFDLGGGMPPATSGTMTEQTLAISEAQVAQLRSSGLYFNIHTPSFPGGEIRGQISLAPTMKFETTLSGAQQVPSVSSPGTGVGTVLLNAAEDLITVNLTFSGLTSNANAAHIHGPAGSGANAGVLFDFTSVTPAATSGTIAERTFAIDATQVTQLKAGQLYFNIHTGNFGGGEIRGQIFLTPSRKFVTSLTGAAQVPPVASPGTGTGNVLLSPTADQITVNAGFASLTSNTNAAHIHGPAGVDGNAGILFNFDGLEIGTTGRIADQTYAISPAQVTQLTSGQHYINVHTANFGGGEVRGQLGAAPMLTVATGGTGVSAAVTSSPAGIMCGGDCAEAYNAGTTVTLTAAAAPAGSFFAGWFGGGCAGTGTCQVAPAADTTVTAVYTLSSTVFAFTDDPLSVGQTAVKAAHIVELRNAINTLRANNGLAAFTFTDSPLSAGAVIKGVHVAELRTAVGAVFTQRGRAVPSFSDPTITATQTAVKGLHISEIRTAIRLVE